MAEPIPQVCTCAIRRSAASVCVLARREGRGGYLTVLGRLSLIISSVQGSHTYPHRHTNSIFILLSLCTHLSFYRPTESSWSERVEPGNRRSSTTCSTLMLEGTCWPLGVAAALRLLPPYSAVPRKSSARALWWRMKTSAFGCTTPFKIRQAVSVAAL